MTAKYIGPENLGLTLGNVYNYQTQHMTGRVYEPGFEIKNGRKVWIDNEGKKDTRIMCWVPDGPTTRFYKVFDNDDQILEYFDPIV